MSQIHPSATPMSAEDRRERLIAAGLSAVAGYVDAVGFLMTGGFFVSFMSGNTTRLGIGLSGDAMHAGIAGSLLASFVLGVVAGSSVGRLAGRRRRPAILVMITGLVLAAAGFAGSGMMAPAVALMTAAMGAENTIFVEGGEVKIGLTYMTGTLVKLGKRIAAALFGGDRFGWAPHLLLWLGLASGSALGAVAWVRFQHAAIWGAAGLLALYTLIMVLEDRKRRPPPAASEPAP